MADYRDVNTDGEHCCIGTDSTADPRGEMITMRSGVDDDDHADRILKDQG